MYLQCKLKPLVVTFIFLNTREITIVAWFNKNEAILVANVNIYTLKGDLLLFSRLQLENKFILVCIACTKEDTQPL